MHLQGKNSGLCIWYCSIDIVNIRVRVSFSLLAWYAFSIGPRARSIARATTQQQETNTTAQDKTTTKSNGKSNKIKPPPTRLHLTITRAIVRDLSLPSLLYSSWIGSSHVRKPRATAASDCHCEEETTMAFWCVLLQQFPPPSSLCFTTSHSLFAFLADIEIKLREHFRVVVTENNGLNGCDIMINIKPSLAVRVYYPNDINRFDEDLKRESPSSSESLYQLLERLHRVDDNEDDVDGLKSFCDLNSNPVCICLLPKINIDRFDNPDSFIHRSQRIMKRSSKVR